MSKPAYPTPEQVEAADKVQLASWVRHLPSPGEAAAGKPDFNAVFRAEEKIMSRVLARFNQLGGWTPDVSKAVGWG